MFKAFRIDEVFVMKRGKEAAPNRVPDGSYNMVNETSTNNGITKKAYSENVFDGNSITVSVNYATTVFYQPEPYCASVNILILENENLDAESAMYVIAMLRKNNQKYDYNHKISKDRLAETVLSYPVIENPNPDHEYTVDDIDWQYMRDRIAELERDRIAELDAYLKVTGLDDYTLTDEDKKILSNATQHEFKEFDLPILFDISTTKSVDKNKLDFVADGEYDFIGRTSVNWGLQGKLHKLSFEPNPKDSFSLIQVGETVALWREREWYASQNLFFLNPKIDKIKENQLYFQGAINKEMSRYGKEYNSYPTMKSLAVTKIFLPVIENSDPGHEYTVDDINWQYMEHYIRAMEKVAIADVVRYKDRVIEETRKLVS